MFVAFFSFIFLLTSLYGYSAFFKLLTTKSVQLKNVDIEVRNIDILYGIFFLVTLLLLLHFFLALKIIVYPIFLIGFFLFIFYLKKKIIKLKNFRLILLINFLVILINSSNGPTYDTQLYHHQLLNWNYNYKIVMNLVLLDDRMAMVSPWQLFLSLGNIKIFELTYALLFNFIPVYILISEVLNSFEKKIKDYKIFIILSSLFVLFYSLIHPFGNGIILMHLGSLGSEFPAMIFFILLIYFYLKNLQFSRVEYRRYILILSTLVVFCRISYFPILLLPIFLEFQKKFFFKEIFFKLFIVSSFFLWIVRSLVNNGCMLFPVKFTCFGFKNYLSPENINEYSNIVKSFARTAPTNEKFMDLNYSIYTYEWFIPWFKNYFLSNSLTQIFFIIIFIIIIPFIFNITETKKIKKNILLLILAHILCFVLWLQAPDIRFILGLFITLPILLIVNLIPKYIYKHFIKIKIFFLFILVGLLFKNHENLNYVFDKNIFLRSYNYENFNYVKNVGNMKVYRNTSDDGFCYDIQPICKINDNHNFLIEKNKFGYLKFIEEN